MNFEDVSHGVGTVTPSAAAFALLSLALVLRVVWHCVELFRSGDSCQPLVGWTCFYIGDAEHDANEKGDDDPFCLRRESWVEPPPPDTEVASESVAPAQMTTFWNIGDDDDVSPAKQRFVRVVNAARAVARMRTLMSSNFSNSVQKISSVIRQRCQQQQAVALSEPFSLPDYAWRSPTSCA
eukprot:TRINITY_DN110998_c0_g1_i1.p1 TRINITY_DN110998_c0_g1~~TRINITY_DN110998_c0_g1_i1.p1  ORF type:complete len:181 (+),score=31.27 TRINITY_DN110998_c0_g1_i1:48-590(+)